MSTFIEQYSVPFKSLKTGIHHFNFELNDRFFESYDNGDCLGGMIGISMQMDKKDHLLSIHCSFSGNARVICSRCLEEFSLPLDFGSTLFVKFDKGNAEQHDIDIIFLDVNENTLHLAGYFFESVCLNLPIRRLHPKDDTGRETCNGEMIRKLHEYTIRKANKVSDPRWDTLKDMTGKYN